MLTEKLCWKFRHEITLRLTLIQDDKTNSQIYQNFQNPERTGLHDKTNPQDFQKLTKFNTLLYFTLFYNLIIQS